MCMFTQCIQDRQVAEQRRRQTPQAILLQVPAELQAKMLASVSAAAAMLQPSATAQTHAQAGEVAQAAQQRRRQGREAVLIEFPAA